MPSHRAAAHPEQAHAHPGDRRRNRLAGQTSLYLREHAANPVDWFPWGEEAFAEARRRGVPIFLSIGYSTCYWCHVMARESFEHEPTARVMNENFVNIKVDREQRPDIDEIYMTAVQLLTGAGGWPMSVFLTPPGARGENDQGLEPFFAGTYFPRDPRPGMPTFTQVLEGMRDAWVNKRDDALKQAGVVTDAIRKHLAATAEPARIGEQQISQAIGGMLRMHDASHGGFGGAPKFPQPVFPEFLLDALPVIDENDQRRTAESALRKTLDRMAIGGLFDKVGGGFHRYSTDAQWLVPHFEKMLYDNGQLAELYARAARRFDDEFYKRVARRTCEYVLREMTADAGAFFSAQDAEIDGREGANYIWRPEQIREVLPQDDAEFALHIYGLDRGTNFQDPHHPDDPPANVLRLGDRPDALAERFGAARDELLDRLDRVNAALYDARQQRKQPATDDKIIAGWNGLMMAGLAESAVALNEPRFLDTARRAARFVLENMRDPQGGLFRLWRDGSAETPAFLDDYAFLIHGLLAIDRAQASAESLSPSPSPSGRGEPSSPGFERAAAEELTEIAEQRFADPQRGGFFDTPAEQRDLIVRTRTAHDGAEPAGASVMLHNLLDLHAITGEPRWLDRAGRALASHSRAIADSPLAAVNSTRALLRVLQTDRSLLDRHGMGEGAPAPQEAPPPGAPSAPPVEIYADADRVAVAKDDPAEVNLELRVTDDQHHINAHDPGVEGLIGLDVRIENGTGVRAEADYPPGEPLDAAWANQDQQPKVHTGAVRLPVRLVRSEEHWTGRPLLIVTYQACTDRACLAPQTVELDVAIDPAPDS